MQPRVGRRDERGETLVEVLAAVVILGITAVAVMAGLQLSIKASDIHRKETTGGAYVRSFGEAIAEYVAELGANKYIPCAGQNAYKVNAVTTALGLPAGYTATQDAAKSVGPTGVAAAGCVTDTGVQLLNLQVTSPDSRVTERLSIIVRKPCDANVATALCTS